MESYTAVSLNYESIDVVCSWKSEEQADKVKNKNAAFSSIWNNIEPNITIVEFPELSDTIINRYKRVAIDDYAFIDDTESLDSLDTNVEEKTYLPFIPHELTLFDYQQEAINAWANNGFRGIFDMATGTGKTLTGLSALIRLCESVHYHLAAIIVCPYQHLVEQWVEDIERFNIKLIIGYSSSPQKNWDKLLENSILDQKLKVNKHEFFCFVCTNATFATERVQKLLGKLRGNILLMVDEAHNFGAVRLSNLLSERYNYRLALSATLERHGDEEGTDKLLSFFGSKCIEYTLERAIEEKQLEIRGLERL